MSGCPWIQIRLMEGMVERSRTDSAPLDCNDAERTYLDLVQRFTATAPSILLAHSVVLPSPAAAVTRAAGDDAV